MTMNIRSLLIWLFASMTAVLLIVSCSNDSPFIKETFVMGTKAIITIYGLDDEKASEAAGRALHELHRIETVMSNWTEESEISRLNSRSDGLPVKISRELFDLIDPPEFPPEASAAG